ncbi:MAG: Gmad2 immunoglobulin-like domain-containing protein [Patescibacteria group bacterium]
MKKYIIAIGILLALGAFGVFYFWHGQSAVPLVSGAKSEVVYRNASADTIVVASPKPGELFGSIIDVQGRARGRWYFEASFPVSVEDSAGNVIGSGVATAGSDWMTTEFVPFTATITLTTSYVGEAKVILKKDNPSGESSRDASITIPITIQ